MRRQRTLSRLGVAIAAAHAVRDRAKPTPRVSASDPLEANGEVVLGELATQIASTGRVSTVESLSAHDQGNRVRWSGLYGRVSAPRRLLPSRRGAPRSAEPAFAIPRVSRCFPVPPLLRTDGAATPAAGRRAHVYVCLSNDALVDASRSKVARFPSRECERPTRPAPSVRCSCIVADRGVSERLPHRVPADQEEKSGATLAGDSARSCHFLRWALTAARQSERFARAVDAASSCDSGRSRGRGIGYEQPMGAFGATLRVSDAGRALPSGLSPPSGIYNVCCDGEVS